MGKENYIVLTLLLALIPYFLSIVHVKASFVLDLSGGVGPVYDGHGGLSAGGTSRLLLDYPPSQRSEILDYLFLPDFGAAISLLKIEIGGDAQSTVGTEASHLHARPKGRATISRCEAGYEGWLAQEARARNPGIQIWSLSWGVPGWIGDDGSYYTEQNIQFQLAWLECLRGRYEVVPNYLGLWNEEAQGSVDYVLALRKALDARGFGNVGITVEATWQPLIRNNILHNATFNVSVAAATLHYPCNTTCTEALQAHKKLWVGEDTPTPFQNWTSASCWGRKLNQHFLKLGATSVTAWALVWSTLPGLASPRNSSAHRFRGTAFLLAEQPWSGHYVVPPTLWIMAHWGQFVEPGWRYLEHEQGSGFLPDGGSFVTLVPSSNTRGDFTMIVETLLGSCGEKCNVAGFNTTQHLIFVVPQNPAAAKLSVWCSNRTSTFIQAPSLPVNNRSFALLMPPDTICTVTTLLSKGRKGHHPSPPSSQPFPGHLRLPTSGPEDSLIPYVSDVYGSFALRNDSLTQLATGKPIGWAAMNLDPLTLVGDDTWESINVEVEISFGNQQGFSASLCEDDTIRVCGGCGNVGYHRIKFACACCFELQSTGHWRVESNGVGWKNGTLFPFDSSTPWRTVRVEMADAAMASVSVDGHQLRLGDGMPPATCLGMVGFGCSSYFPCAFRNISLDATSSSEAESS